MSQHFRSGLPLKGLFTLLVWVISGITFAASSDDLINRIAPVGSVCLIGDSCAGNATVAVAGSGGGSQDPQQIYNTYCIACHGTGVNNSPIMGDTVAWQPRIDKGLEVLYQNAINGFNNNLMPVKGLCMACSDEDLQATVDYILTAGQ